MSLGCSGKLENNLQIIDNCRDFKNGCITLYNDGKEKNNSFEARVIFETYLNYSQIVIECIVYEDSRENSLKELQKEYNSLVEQFKEDFNISESKVKNCANCKYYDYINTRCNNKCSLFYQNVMLNEDYCSKCWKLNEN